MELLVLKRLLLAAALTPVCWVGVLIAMRRIRQTGLVGSGLDELFDEVERYTWIVGVFLALVLVNLVGGKR
jgi:hypothetical protein